MFESFVYKSISFVNWFEGMICEDRAFFRINGQTHPISIKWSFLT